MKELIKNKKGITLVALVITVVVMLILAGVAISAIVGEEGLFSKIRETVGIHENAVQKEEDELSNLINEITNYNTIYIYTKEELEQFRDDVNNGNTFEGKTVMLMNDIDLAGDENDKSTWWKPIGFNISFDPNSEYINKETFSGVFEGNNHVIEGIYNKTEEGMESIGFFSCVNNATIKNLTVSGNIVLGANIGEDTNLMAGGLIGVSYGNNVILNCINKVNVTKLSLGRDVAGFVGAIGEVGGEESNLTIKNCINYGNITGSNNCGGIVGAITKGNLIIENTCNKGNITNYLGSYVGGLISRDNSEGTCSVMISNSYNDGVIKGKGDTGGLIGRFYGNVNISNSYNNGEIYNDQRTKYSCIGGIIGRVIQLSSNCTIVNSYNNSNIIIEEGDYGTYVGGLIGETRAINTNILNSYNLGNISNGTYVSGICGAVYSPSNPSTVININNCYNVGSVSGVNTRGIMLIYNSPITVNVKNVYLLDTVSDVGISNLDTENPLEIPVNMLSEDEMKREDFVNELNSNLLSIDTEYNLRNWKYVSDNYPIFE